MKRFLGFLVFLALAILAMTTFQTTPAFAAEDPGLKALKAMGIRIDDLGRSTTRNTAQAQVRADRVVLKNHNIKIEMITNNLTKLTDSSGPIAQAKEKAESAETTALNASNVAADAMNEASAAKSRAGSAPWALLAALVASFVALLTNLRINGLIDTLRNYGCHAIAAWDSDALLEKRKKEMEAARRKAEKDEAARQKAEDQKKKTPTPSPGPPADPNKTNLT